MDALPNGRYDAVVVDAGDAGDGAIRLELVVSSGAHKATVVAVRATGLACDAIDLLGLPVTLTVDEHGRSIELD